MSERPIFLKRRRLGARLFAVTAACAVLLMVDSTHLRPVGMLGNVRHVLDELVQPLYDMIDAPFRMLSRMAPYIRRQNDLVLENRRLHEENLILRSQLQRLAALEAENSRLRRLDQQIQGMDRRAVLASILMVSLDPFRHEVLLNVGRNQGIQQGSVVLDEYGVMGQVISVASHTARALLISDPDHALPVEVLRNGTHTIAQGTGDMGRLSIQYLPLTTDIRVGDLLVTSGLGGRFRRGDRVAIVQEVRREPGARFLGVDATPVAHLSRSREVIILPPYDPLVGYGAG
jgi:rod shape-determining protein MreC